MNRKKKSNEVRRLSGTAILLAVAIVLSFIANYVSIGTFSINLSLIPIVLAAIVYGPISSTVIGLVVGIITIFAPSTLGMISTIQAVTSNAALVTFETVVVCIVKMVLTGLLTGFIFYGLNKKNFNLAVIITSLSAPIINTGTFAIFMSTMMRNDIMLAFQGTFNGASFAYILFVGFIGVNFFIEFGINAALSPAILYLCKYLLKSKNIGSDTIGKTPIIENNDEKLS